MTDDRKSLIDLGQLPTRNLAECLAVDQVTLANTLVTRLPAALVEQLAACADQVQTLGLSKKVAAIGLALGQWLEHAPAPCARRCSSNAVHTRPTPYAAGQPSLRHTFHARCLHKTPCWRSCALPAMSILVYANGPGLPCAHAWHSSWTPPCPCSAATPATQTRWCDAFVSKSCAHVASGVGT